MKKLLISGVGGSLFPYLFDKLNDKYKLFFIDSDSFVLNLYPNENIIIVPKVSDNIFVSVIKKIIIDNKIDYYIPLIDEEISIAIDVAKELSIKVLAPSKEFVVLTLNKYNLMNKLSKENISMIQTVMADEFVNQIQYPVFLKPNIGRGSRGIKKINNKEEFEAYFILEKYIKKEVLVQPFITGDEYTVSVTVNNLNQLIAIVPKLVYTKQGITKHAQSIKNSKIEAICRNIVSLLKPCGSFNVQLKYLDNQVYIFEINPRFSTTLVLSIESGINEIDLNIKYFDIPKVIYISDFKEKKLIRRWENCFYE